MGTFEGKGTPQTFAKQRARVQAWYCGDFLTNCYTCFRGNSISKRFGMNRITLDEYISLNEVIEPFVEDVDDEFMDGEIFA